MIAVKEPDMGRFSVEVELANHEDIILAKAGQMPQERVRRLRVRGVVDSGATRLVVPESVAKQLGLEIVSRTTVHYADQHSAERGVVQDVHLGYGGRESVFSAIVEPQWESILIGAIVLEELDLLVDCTNQRLAPRDPKQIISWIE